MNFLSLLFTQALTDRLMKTAACEGLKESDSQCARPVPILSKFFLGSMLLGFLFAVIAFLLHAHGVAFFFLLFFWGISIPPLIACRSQRILFDSKGFTVFSFPARQHQYSYADITGYSDEGSSFEIEVCGQKRICLDMFWQNRFLFREMVLQHCPKKLKKVIPSVFSMSSCDIESSYQNGILRKALIVREEDLGRRFFRLRCLHYALCITAVLLLIFSILFSGRPDSGSMLISFGAAFLTNAMAAFSLVLYFRFPSFFTMREKPAQEYIDPQIKKQHKLCTFLCLSLPALFCSALFMLSAAQHFEFHTFPLVLSLILCSLLLIGLIVVFRRFSFEYRNYRLGFISFLFALFLFIASVFLFLLSLTLLW